MVTIHMVVEIISTQPFLKLKHTLPRINNDPLAKMVGHFLKGHLGYVTL